jgi:hypothetical protein
MKRGMGIAVAFGLLSVLISIWVYLSMEKKTKREINPQMADQLKTMNELNAQTVINAASAYEQQNHKLPEKIEDLIPKYIAELPKEAFSKLTVTVAVYDGKGGWVYSGGAFLPNDPQMPNVP